MILELGVTDDPEEVGYYSGFIESLLAFTALITSKCGCHLLNTVLCFFTSDAVDIRFRPVGTQARSSHWCFWSKRLYVPFRFQSLVLAYVHNTVPLWCLCWRIFVSIFTFVPFFVSDELIEFLLHHQKYPASHACRNYYEIHSRVRTGHVWCTSPIYII